MPESQNCEFEIGKVYSIHLSKLMPNPAQPRKHFDDEINALATDIKANSLLQDITFTAMMAS